ncbi:MAG: hypothetical protein DM484_26055 [Candidatus Methylumidiphilus alinenensis]|uniref:Uncharacterized protein n=1 Tax=Candidatus Methylumidiphilus alinenensis TaxID=2202197 RepID=A0A2W4QMB9_9GAMM|nr:MAG: hypothetical protein DM484_26055 [Candidatus Methylumidiphilus alinenensis]
MSIKISIGRGITLGCLSCLSIVLPAVTFTAWADTGPVTWQKNNSPVETMITGGPWTLEQSGAANGLKSSGYCDANGNQIGNPGTQRMQPYYFPVIVGEGNNLQGYFDWRPKDTDEAVVAANSTDGGYTWNFQQKVLELRTTCPTNVQADPDGDKDNSPDPNNSDNGNDDGQGHSYVALVNGHTYLYTLNRAAGHIDSDPLIIHDLSPTASLPLGSNLPALSDVANPPLQTKGLMNPDGILATIPGTSPLKVIYEQKILSGDNTGATALPVSQQCATTWASYYKANGGLAANDDITYLRLATTTDGITFTDVGPLKGLNDPTTVAANGTRWVATAGTVIQLANGKYGLLYSGGSCIDADSDSFHYIGYAESADLLNWTVINGFDNPIASVAPVTLSLTAGVPVASGGQTQTIPANPAVVGNTMGWFAGRVYGPSATRVDANNITLVFAGYHTPKPKNGLGDYRTIGRVSLHSSVGLGVVGQPGYSASAYAQSCLFDWAEAYYPSLFSPSGASTQTSSAYNYRYYKASNSYVGVSTSNSHVYYQGPDGVIQDVGSLTGWLTTAKCQ